MLDDLKLINFWLPLEQQISQMMCAYFNYQGLLLKISHEVKLDGGLSLTLKWCLLVEGSAENLVILKADGNLTKEQVDAIIAKPRQTMLGLNKLQDLIFPEVMRVNNSLITGLTQSLFKRHVDTFLKRESVLES